MPRCDSRNCAACEKEGVIRAADRVKSNGEGLCDEHFRKEFGQPPLITTHVAKLPNPPAPAEEKKREIVTVNINWGDVQRLRDAGELTMKQLAEKFDVSVATVRNHTKPAKDKTRLSTTMQTIDGAFGRAIKELEAERGILETKIGKINDAIEALRELTK